MDNNSCPFCNMPEDEKIFSNELAYVVNDKYPDSKGHLLIVTNRHIKDFSEASAEERNAIMELAEKAKIYTDEKYTPPGYKLITNMGSKAGQVIFHLHFHLLPYY